MPKHSPELNDALEDNLEFDIFEDEGEDELGEEEGPKIFSITELNAHSRIALEKVLGNVWVEGEISNFSKPSSGHMYFSLKDANCQIRCAMFRFSNMRLNFKPASGNQVLVQGKISLYEPRGDYQLIVSHMEEAGDGALRRKFEQLKQQLNKEGLFNQANKKPLPKLPNQIGIITSDTGAAVRDVLSVLKRRCPSIPIVIYPTQVQGDKAAGLIVKAIETANARRECDVLILTRGGGALEDLWSFNEEIVARAIFASEIPIISGVGHEVDTTIADYVADQRAATPSAAAELVCPDQSHWIHEVRQFKNRLNQAMKWQLDQAKLKLTTLMHALKRPDQKLMEYSQNLDQLEMRLKNRMQHILQNKKHLLSQSSQTLNAISPLNTLARGYAILTGENGKVIQSVKQVKTGDKVVAKVVDGEIEMVVEKLKSHE